MTKEEVLDWVDQSVSGYTPNADEECMKTLASELRAAEARLDEIQHRIRTAENGANISPTVCFVNRARYDALVAAEAKCAELEAAFEEGDRCLSLAGYEIEKLQAKCAELTDRVVVQDRQIGEYAEYVKKCAVIEAKCAAMENIVAKVKQLHDMVLVDKRTDINAAAATVIHAYREYHEKVGDK